MNVSVLLLALCQALIMSGNILLIAVSALIGEQLAAQPSLATLPLAVQFLGLMAATIPASLIMAKIGRRKGFVLGNLMGISGTLIAVFSLYAQSFALYSLAAFFLGIGIGFATLYRFAAVEVCAPEQKNRAISLVMAGGIVAAVVGPNLTIYSRNWFAETPFVGAYAALCGLYILALGLLFLVRLPAVSAQQIAGEKRPVLQILSQPKFIIASFSGMVGYTVMNLIMTATPLSMTHHGHHFSDSTWVIQWHVLGMFAPSFITGSLINRFGVSRMIVSGVILMLACIAINLSGQSVWHYWTALVLLGMGWNFMFIPASAMVTETYRPAEKSVAQASNEFLVFSMVAVSSLSAGWLENVYGWQWINLLALPILVLNLMLILWLSRSTPKPVAMSNG